MKTHALLALALPVLVLAGCGGGSDGGGGTGPTGAKTVSGTMSFVLGSAAGTGAAVLPRVQASFASLAPGDEYIVSPLRAKITFTSVIFRGATGESLGESAFGACTVTYDAAAASAGTLLDCPFTAPVGDVYQLTVSYDKVIQLMVSDAAMGIYSNPSSATGFSTSAPAGGAAYVPFTVTIGTGTTRGTPIIFAKPLTISAGTSPTLFVTTDMMHTLQLKVDAGGSTLSPSGSNDPVVLFGGPTRGFSRYYSDAPGAGGYKVGGFKSLRVFYDGAGVPAFLIGPTCGVDGPKSAWASPPIGATIGGWLGRDAAGNIAWALPTTTSYATYAAYQVMAEQRTLGGTTVLNCRATASPPPPADGKTYGSGAPAMPVPDSRTTLKLLAQ